jgi:predicted permease
MERKVETLQTLRTTTFIVFSSVYAIVIAMGTLTIALSLTAWANGTNFVEYYQYVFPHFRGTSPGMQIPPFGYAAFLMYIAVAASVAIHARKRFERAWIQRRNG